MYVVPGTQCADVPLNLPTPQATSVMKCVRGIIQIVGHSTVPATSTKLEDVTDWYRKVCVLFHQG